MNALPIYIPVVFILTTLLGIHLFYKASGKNRNILYFIIAWIIIQGLLGWSGFYTVSTQPRFLLTVLPQLIAVTWLFTSASGKQMLDGFDAGQLTRLHAIRIVVEIVLFWLFIHKTMPGLMTFEGRNFDMISGLTAPAVYYFGYVKKRLSLRMLLSWNVLCLAILAFTVGNAILSIPTPIQQFAFEQPSRAVLHFPYIWLPAVLVPIVYTSHIIVIRELLIKMKSKKLLTMQKAGAA